MTDRPSKEARRKPKEQSPSGSGLSAGEEVERLRVEMEAAAASGEFELAARLRDRIALMRGGASAAEAAAADTSGLRRQQPGAMGLGTSQQKTTPPKGWVRPKKPDPRRPDGHGLKRPDTDRLPTKGKWRRQLV